jgi:hypothetical protein
LFDDVFVEPERLHHCHVQETQSDERAPSPKPTEFAISLMVYVDATIWKCPLLGHEDDDGSSNEDENSNEKNQCL